MQKVTDYHDMVTIDSPKEMRKRLNIGDIWINEATCGRCGVTVRSRNRHDFRTCRCNALAVDGGSWYAKRSFDPEIPFKDNIVMFSDVEEKK